MQTAEQIHDRLAREAAEDQARELAMMTARSEVARLEREERADAFKRALQRKGQN